MHIRSNIIISSIVFLAVTSTALAREGSLPKIEFQTLCRARQITIDAVFSNQNSNAFDSCVSSEQDARDKLLARWASIAALDKTYCIHPSAFSPSYLEWLGCIMTREFAQGLRKGRPVSAPVQGPCPHVTWKLDGTISSAEICNLSSVLYEKTSLDSPPNRRLCIWCSSARGGPVVIGTKRGVGPCWINVDGLWFWNVAVCPKAWIAVIAV